MIPLTAEDARLVAAAVVADESLTDAERLRLVGVVFDAAAEPVTLDVVGSLQTSPLCTSTGERGAV